MEGFDFVRMKPSNEIIRSNHITGTKATVRALAEAGKAYALYLNGGTGATLELDIPAGAYKAEWLNTKNGKIERGDTFTHTGGPRPIMSPPYSEDIALRLTKVLSP